MLCKLRAFKNNYSSLSDAAKATFWFFVCSIFTKCISMITTPIFTRLLSADQYGLYNVYLSWFQIVTMIVTFRLDHAIFNKGMSKYPKNRNEYTSTMQTITSAITIIFFVLYVIFHNQINQLTELTTVVTLLLFTEAFFSNATSLWIIRQRYEFKYKSVIFVSVSICILNAGLGVFAVYLFHNSGLARIVSCVLVQACAGLIIYIINIKNSKKLFVKEYAKFAILFNLPLIPHYFSSYILDQFDKIMIQKMVNRAAVGIYSIAYTSGFVIKIVVNSLNSTLIPWQYKRLEEKEYDNLAKCIYSIVHFVLACFMLYMAFAPEIIKIMASSEYADAVYMLPPVTASAFLIFLYSLFVNIEFFFNKNKMTMYIAMVGAVMNIGLNYLCISLWGYYMAAYTTLICYAYFTITHYLYMNFVTKKNIGIIIFSNRKISLYIVLVLASTAFSLVLVEFTIARYIWIACMLSYFVIRRKKLMEFMHLLK